MDIKLIYGNLQDSDALRVLVFDEAKKNEIKNENNYDTIQYGYAYGEINDEDFNKKLNSKIESCIKNKTTKIIFDLTNNNRKDTSKLLNIILTEMKFILNKFENEDLTVKVNMKMPELNDELIREIHDYINIQTNISKNSFGDKYDDQREQLEEYLKNNKSKNAIPFDKYLNDLMIKKGLDNKQVYDAAHISKGHFSKVNSASNKKPNMDDEKCKCSEEDKQERIQMERDIHLKDLLYRTSKSTVAALAIALKLSINEMEEFYHAAGYHFGNYEPEDKIIRWHVENKIYDVGRINECMEFYKEKYYYQFRLLGEKVRENKSDKIEKDNYSEYDATNEIRYDR